MKILSVISLAYLWAMLLACHFAWYRMKDGTSRLGLGAVIIAIVLGIIGWAR